MRIGFPSKPMNSSLWIATKSLKISLERFGYIGNFLNELGIDFYRFPSKMFPLKVVKIEREGGEIEKKVPNIDEVRANVNGIVNLGRFFRAKDIRTCFHASQYCNPVSLIPDVVDRSVLEIEVISYFISKFGGDGFVETRIGPLGEKTRKEAFERFEFFWSKLSNSAKSKVIFENDARDKFLGTTLDLIELSETFGISKVFDIGNFIRNPNEPHNDYVKIFYKFVDEWKHGIPVIHYDNLRVEDIKNNEDERVNPEFFWDFVSCFSDRDFDVILMTGRREFDVVAVKTYAEKNDVGVKIE